MNTVLITGVKGNLGRAVATEFNHRGWNVTGLDRDDVDCTNADEVQSWVNSQDLSTLAAVVHTIGGIRAGRAVHEAPLDDANVMMNLNYFTTLHVARAVIPRLRTNAGAFVAVGAQATLNVTQAKGYYAASKAALNALVLTIAEEGRHDGLRANVVVPSILRTPENLEWAEGGEEESWVTPEQVAFVIAALCDTNNRTSGAIIPVLGGVAR